MAADDVICDVRHNLEPVLVCLSTERRNESIDHFASAACTSASAAVTLACCSLGVDLRQHLVGDNMIANINVAPADSKSQITLELGPDFSC
jgi:hypothetical protein